MDEATLMKVPVAWSGDSDCSAGAKGAHGSAVVAVAAGGGGCGGSGGGQWPRTLNDQSG